jgi:hypothetical protein
VGLDVYVGSLVRYTAGDWLTVVQQAGLAQGVPVEVIRTDQSADVVTDLEEISEAVAHFQASLGGGLGLPCDWPEGADLPYWTDKPDWDGYGGLVLLAAYDERPDLRPNATEASGHDVRTDDPREFGGAAAYQAAAAAPSRYRTLLSGVEWWLPVGGDVGVWRAPTVAGQPVVMGSVDSLLQELQELAARTGIGDEQATETIRHQGPPAPGAPAEETGRFGLAVFTALAELAAANRQPLLLDY